jgi:hypothetical protein
MYFEGATFALFAPKKGTIFLTAMKQSAYSVVGLFKVIIIIS